MLHEYYPKIFEISVFVFFFALSPNANLDACDGTLVPVCGRSIFLAKFAPPTVVLPASGSINVPIGILPFVTWNTSTATCAQPISATLTLTLTCTPVGGSPVVIGPQNFTVPTPTVPGPQFLGGPVNFVIPAGTLPPGTPAICTVAGSYVGNQVAGLPDGVSKDDAFGMDVFAISAIDPGTDTFPAAFAQNLSPGELLHGDPTTPSAQELSDNVAKDSSSSEPDSVNVFDQNGSPVPWTANVRGPGEVSLRLYDINGRLVRTIVEQKLPAGTHAYAWDAKDNTSRPFASGMYFYVLSVKNLSTKNVVYTEKKKMLLVK